MENFRCARPAALCVMEARRMLTGASREAAKAQAMPPHAWGRRARAHHAGVAPIMARRGGEVPTPPPLVPSPQGRIRVNNGVVRMIQLWLPCHPKPETAANARPHKGDCCEILDAAALINTEHPFLAG
mmetsp:Transcript_13996/g.39328  ORF Transcript_13996/g.39328 Transcript_13996/m.39328 type:complete len:128 (+) Transcript_13996:1701-2084(+)